MPRMIELIRKSQMSANMMHAAARGALAVPPGEMLEILVHLALHNKVFGELARMTLAGWDEKASRGVAADPTTSREVLQYLLSPRNIRPALLPALLENPAITQDELSEMAADGSRSVVEAMLVSARVKKSPQLIEALRSNPRVRPNEIELIEAAALSLKEEVAHPPVLDHVEAERAPQTVAASGDAASSEVEDDSVDDQVLAQAITHYLEANAAELASAADRPFQEVPMPEEGVLGGASAEHPPATEGATAASAKPATSTYAGASFKPKKHVHPGEERRDSTLQKIAKLDVKGRIALAVRGNKEERSILIRDGTKLVALAVLDSPKISDNEVEKIALQKNVLEAVLRAIPLKRRFKKNYTIMRNLVFNPRTPLDQSLGLMKNLLVHDLKNLSGNKEVSETIRKLALRMFKQKIEKKD